MKNKLVNLNIHVCKEIQYMLEKEHYREGDKLPGERTLAEQFGVQRHTVRTALVLLEHRGIITTREKSGHYMAKPRTSVFLDKFLEPEYLVSRDKESFHLRILQFERVPVSRNLIYTMHLREGTDIFRILLLWSDGDKPVCLERSFIPCTSTPLLREQDLQSGSRYRIMAVSYMDQKMEIVQAETLEAELLKLPLSHPLIRFSGFTFNRTNECIEYFERRIPSETYTFYC